MTERRLQSFPYSYLQPICDSDYVRQYPSTGPNHTSEIDYDWQAFCREGGQGQNIERMATYHKVRPLWQNVMAQIQKCDAPAVLPSGPAWQKTMELSHAFFAFLKSEPAHEESENTYDLNTSPGLPWIKMGYKKKKHVLEHEPERLQKFAFDVSYEVIDTYNDKEELLEEADFLRNKVRGIFGSSFHGVYREKFLYGRQNTKLLSRWKEDWIKYGSVKQYGGFNSMIQQLEPFPFVWESDVSGYDRKVFLGPVYEIRNANIDDPNHYYDDLKASVTESNVFPKVLLPNGYVVRRQTGNDSGKNNTTTDNSIAHQIIMFYMLVKRLMEFGVEPTLSYIFKWSKIFIYSDDKLGGIHLDKFFF